MKEKRNLTDRFLNIIEKAGNTLPHPATLFFLLSLFVVVLSWIVSAIGFSATHPATGEEIKPFNLISKEGLALILTKMVTNFTSFAPLGTVLVSMLGIGIAESSGLIGTSLRLLVISSPKKLLTFVIVFTGILSNTASEVGYVLLVPLAGIVFLSVGRHPLAGIAAAFAGVSGGYSANLFLGTIDPLLSGLTQEAAHIIDKDYIVNPAANYFFLAASTPLIALLGTFVTEKVIIPRLGEYKSDEKIETENITELPKSEKKGLIYAAISGLIFALIVLLMIIPENGILRGPIDPTTGKPSIFNSPFMNGIVAFIFLGAAIMGIFYGIGTGSIKNDNDVVKGMGKSIESMGIYIVLTFFAAQFVAYFNWTQIGKIFAIEGATLLSSSGLGTIPLMIFFIIIASFINLIMGSASAKWALMAPIFVPMFMLLGYTPEFIQLAYRIGDSVTNIISPMMSYFALIIAFVHKYDKKAGIGSIISLMLPYTIVFFIGWVLFFIIWYLLGIPVGPDAPIYLNQK